MCPYYCFTMVLQAIHFMILVLILLLLLLLMKNEDKSGMDRMKTRMKNTQNCNNGDIDAFLGNAPELYNNKLKFNYAQLKSNQIKIFERLNKNNKYFLNIF